MKILLTLLVLLFSPSVFAEDISDFQIEGISIGDSLLDYFSEDEIKKNTGFNVYDYKKDKTFVLAAFEKTSQNEYYDILQVHYKRNDKKRILYGISGMNYYKNNIDNCYIKKVEIIKQISPILEKAKKTNESGKHDADASGKSTVDSTFFDFVSGDYVSVACYDWSNEVPYLDKLVVSVTSKELGTWLISN
tara:strand:- start:345 stop:917 length:573 start_codon:yes stop_codon:yes gene_type:complete